VLIHQLDNISLRIHSVVTNWTERVGQKDWNVTTVHVSVKWKLLIDLCATHRRFTDLVMQKVSNIICCNLIWKSAFKHWKNVSIFRNFRSIRTLLVLLPVFQKGSFLRKRAGSSFGQKGAICVVQGKTWKTGQNFTTFRVNKMFSHKF
jgi:hypothetical protein